MPSITQLSLEMRVGDCANRAAWVWAQAAACPWWAVIRRLCLVRKARLIEREMDAWAAALYEELAVARRFEDWETP